MKDEKLKQDMNQKQKQLESFKVSYRMMESFSINTFRFVNEEGKAHFVRLHWKPVLGVHSFVWDEAQKISGSDPDYHRRDIFESIEDGNYPEFELGVQIIKEADEFKFDFDILDATKFWPEEEIPVHIIGKMTLNKNVDNFFAETEQVAFHPGHVVPGIDFTNDPLLQGRLFSYTDTQLIRLGGPNFHEIPINKPTAPIHNNQRDGYHRQMINKGKVSYHRNGIWNSTPMPVSEADGGFAHYQEKVDGKKIRARSESFKDHFSQARIFWNSMSNIEKKHIIKAFSFEVGKVKDKDIKQQVIEMFSNVSVDMANQIAQAIGVNPPQNQVEPKVKKVYPSVSQANTISKLNTRVVAVVVADDFNEVLMPVLDELKTSGLDIEIISDKLGIVKGGNHELDVAHTFMTASSVLFDSVLAVGGKKQNPMFNENAQTFIKEAFMHYKPIAAFAEGTQLLNEQTMVSAPGVVLSNDVNNQFTEDFKNAILAHRHWDRVSIY